jgi:damage-control phosphatase, subfamily I
LKTYLDCLPCILNQTLRAVRQTTANEDIQREVLNAVAAAIPLMHVDLRPPEIACEGYRLIRDITGDDDPYRKIKTAANKKALKLYPEIKNLVNQSECPLLTACKLAIAGNSIDHGPSLAAEVETVFESAVKTELAANDFIEFEDNIKNASLILYIGDNCGEIVFDRVLLEEIEKSTKAEIIFAVRGRPVINDVTESDAVETGVDKICKIISNGTDIPGTILKKCSPEFKQYYESADVVISKGQGNYESLEGEKGNIFFLLKAKCDLAARLLGVKVGDAVMKHQNLMG